MITDRIGVSKSILKLIHPVRINSRSVLWLSGMTTELHTDIGKSETEQHVGKACLRNTVRKK